MNANEVLLNAIRTGDVESVSTIVQSDPALLSQPVDTGISPVLVAMYNGQPRVARVLVDMGAPLDIFEASAVGELSRVQEIIDRQPAVASAYAPDGFTPLGLAAFFGHVEVAHALLHAGADVNAASHNALKVAPLHSAVASRQTDLSRLLVEHGADVNAKQQEDFTPLMEAAQNGDLEIVNLLLASGADPQVVKSGGQTALDIAQAAGHQQIVDALRRHAKSAEECCL
jgi:ankyrin repeat protein